MAATISGPHISHIVLNVRNIDASERFYTEMLGFERCGKLADRPGREPVDMRFFKGGGDNHHDLALVQLKGEAATSPVPDWSMFTDIPGIGHLALAYGTREEWLAQIEHLQKSGVEFKVRGNHGMTHSAYVVDPDGHGIEVLYDLPSEVWAGDVDAALSFFEPLPTTGSGSLDDDADYKVFG